MTARHGVQLFADVHVTLHVALERTWDPLASASVRLGWNNASAQREALGTNSGTPWHCWSQASTCSQARILNTRHHRKIHRALTGIDIPGVNTRKSHVASGLQCVPKPVTTKSRSPLCRQEKLCSASTRAPSRSRRPSRTSHVQKVGKHENVPRGKTTYDLGRDADFETKRHLCACVRRVQWCHRVLCAVHTTHARVRRACAACTRCAALCCAALRVAPRRMCRVAHASLGCEPRRLLAR